MLSPGAKDNECRIAAGRDAADLPSMAPRVALLYLSVYLHYGLIAFLPLWLKATGSSSAEIGTLMAVPLVLRILTVAPVAGWIGRRGWVRHAIAAAAVASALAALLLLFEPAGVARLLAIVAFALLWDQIPVLVDAYAVMTVRSQGLDFGRLRVWGSIAVVASNAAAGLAVMRLGITALPWLIAAMLLLPAGASTLLPRDRRLMREAPEAGGGWRELLSDRPLVAAMAAASLVMGSHGVLQSFGAIRWAEQGLSSGRIGIVNAVAVASEILFFVVGQRLLRGRDPRLLLVLGALTAAARWAIMAFDPGFPMLIVAQLLQGVTASGAILAPVLLIAARVPNRLASAAQGMNAVVLGIVLAATTAGAGLLWRHGVTVAYLTMSVTALLAAPVIVIGNRARFRSDR